MSSDHDDDAATFEDVAKQAHELLKKAGGPVTRIAVQSGEHMIEIEWDPNAAPPAGVSPGGYGLPASTESAAAAGADTSGLVPVTAPLVGTFYRSPEPGAKPFVEIGDLVEADQEIGIIEAMKIMNRIVADVPGRVARILVADGDMVEFGQPLIQLEPPDAAS
jgi:acetyl-CoA carboxylase biotin carboxyl carrier protein